MANEKALKTIKKGLELQLKKSPKAKREAFEIDAGDISPALKGFKKSFSNEEAFNAAAFAIMTGIDIKLNPEKYSRKEIEKRVTKKGFNAFMNAIDDGINGILREAGMPSGMTVGAGYQDIESFKKGTPDIITGRYKYGPLSLEAGVNPKNRENFNVGVRFRLPLGGKAKGGKVKQYAKGGGVRKPRLK